ncbi:glycosyltransferase family 2 protein [Mycobacterium sp. NPDC050551]|uniref:glycosyltransferase family 2 protein n=1 Tax=Mycobacterium sp. NPDC050551 TaxID=3155407 RepID=UPI003412EBC5
MVEARGEDDGGRPFVSFLTTAFETEQYVGEMIESVLAQTDGDWELVVVDNGCSDAMADVVRPYTADSRIHLVRQENEGYTGGVSAAAAAASGRYLCVLDSDDALAPRFCERSRSLVVADPGIDGIGCNAVMFRDLDSDGELEDFFTSTGRRTRPDPSRAVTFSELLAEGAPPYVGLIRREVWDDLGGYECPADIEPDVILWLRLVSTGRDLRILPDSLVKTRFRPESLSHHPDKVDAFQLRLQHSYLTVAREHGVGDAVAARSDVVRRLRYHHALRTARSALIDGEILDARRAARDAFRQRRTLRAVVAVAATHLGRDVALRLRAVKNDVGDGMRRRTRRRHAGSVG